MLCDVRRVAHATAGPSGAHSDRGADGLLRTTRRSSPRRPRQIATGLRGLDRLDRLSAALACTARLGRTRRPRRAARRSRRAASRRRSRPLYFRRNQEIHAEIVRLAGNPVRRRPGRRSAVYRARAQANYVGSRWEDSSTSARRCSWHISAGSTPRASRRAMATPTRADRRRRARRPRSRHTTGDAT